MLKGKSLRVIVAKPSPTYKYVSVVSSVEAVAPLVQVARLYHYYHHTLSGEFARCSLDPIMPGPMSDLKPELERASPALGLS